MRDCCETYAQTFDAGEARRLARRYRRRGLEGSERDLAAFLTRRGVAGLTVLEVGGGIGAIQIELLRAGAARAVNVELSSGYEDAARALLREAGLADRVERVVMDFAARADLVEPADAVVLHRVVCCYPDMRALVTEAARRARRRLAMTYPRGTWWNRLGVWAGNAWLRLRGSGFRAYVHAPDQILATAQGEGLRLVEQRRGSFWESVLLER